MSEYGNISKEELDQARYFLAGIKNQKLIEVAHKHTNDMLRFHDVRRHMNGEVQEFKNIAYSMDTNLMLKELADISNCVDIMAMILLRDLNGSLTIEAKKTVNV